MLKHGCRHIPAERSAGHVNQVLMVGKEQHLRFFRELAQYFEPGSSALIVIIDKQIISDERS